MPCKNQFAFELIHYKATPILKIVLRASLREKVHFQKNKKIFLFFCSLYAQITKFARKTKIYFYCHISAKNSLRSCHFSDFPPYLPNISDFYSQNVMKFGQNGKYQLHTSLLFSFDILWGILRTFVGVALGTLMTVKEIFLIYIQPICSEAKIARKTIPNMIFLFLFFL